MRQGVLIPFARTAALSLFFMFLNFPSNGVAEGLLTQQQLNQDVHGQTVTREYWTYVPGALAKNPALVVVIHG